MVKLDILSDPICPWCYIGKTNLERALETRADHPFEIEWHPFQLNPLMAQGGIDRRRYLEEKFGGKQGAIDVYGRIDQAAKAVGLNINWQGITKTPNTFNAHRLIHWAGLEGKQTPVVAAIFRGYFQEGKDIGETAVLVDLAAEAGLDKDVIARLFDGDADVQALRERETHSRQMGVNSVPTFIVGNRAVVPGAQSGEFWTGVIDDYQDKLETTP